MSFMTGQEGSFLTVVGGCRFAQSPYKTIVEIDIDKQKVTGSLAMETGLVSHDLVEREGKLYIFGGSNGGDFSNYIYVLN